MSVPKRVDTLVMITDRVKNQILLGMKKRGFGSGKWNGFGGKVEPNETIEEAAKRECLEECNLFCPTLEKVGVMNFKFLDHCLTDTNQVVPKRLEIHVFRAQEYSGQVKESEEMRPKWFPIEDIPYDQMWADDRHWLPLVLKGSHFRAHFTFRGQSTLTEYVVQELSANQSAIEPFF